MTTGSNGAIKQSVRAGLGLGMLPRKAVSLELGLGLLKELDLEEELPRRRWYALLAAGEPRRRVVENFLTSDAARRAVEETLLG